MILRNLYWIKPNFPTPHLVLGCGDTKYDLVNGRLSMADHSKARAMLAAISPDGEGDYEVVRFVKGYNGRDYDAHDVMKKIPFAKKHSELFAFRGTHSYTAEWVADHCCEELGIGGDNNSADKIKLETRPYQDEFVKKANKVYLEFLLWAKCRAGKSTMVVRHVIDRGFKLTLISSRRKSPFSSWKKDPSKYEGFENIRTVEIGELGWKEQLTSYMKQEGIQVMLWGTIQKLKNLQDELKELYTPDLLVFDECHVGSKGKQWKELRSLFSDTPCMKISGTAQEQIWEYGDEMVYAYSYWDEQLDNEKGIFNPLRPKMRVYTVNYMTEEYVKIFGNSPDAMQNIFAIEKDDNGCVGFKYRTLVVDFINKYFNQRRILNVDNRLFGKSQHILMSLPSVDACDLFAEMIPNEYATLVVTGKKGHNEDSISKFIDENETGKTITLTVEANVLGVTEKRWDTIVNCKGGKDPKFWTQFAFRGGSGTEDWIVVDFSTKICLETLRKDFALAQLKNPELSTRNFIDFVHVIEWTEQGFVELTHEKICKIFGGDVGDTRKLMTSIGNKLNLGKLADFGFDLRLEPSEKDNSKKILITGQDANNKSNVVLDRVPSKIVNKTSDEILSKVNTIDAILERIPLVLFYQLLNSNRLDTIDQVVGSGSYIGITGDNENIISQSLEQGIISRQDFVYILTQCNDDIEESFNNGESFTLDKLSHSRKDQQHIPLDLLDKMLSKAPVCGKLLVICDPSGLHSLRAIEYGWKPEDITVWENDPCHVYSIRQVDNKITIIEDYETTLKPLDDSFMKTFNVVLQNPPYGNKDGGGSLKGGTTNPPWLQFTNVGLSLLKDDGIFLGVTPTAIVGGAVDFTENFIGSDRKNSITSVDFDDMKKYFPKEGTNICWWTMKKGCQESCVVSDGRVLDLDKTLIITEDKDFDDQFHSIANKGKTLHFHTNGRYEYATVERHLIKKGHTKDEARKLARDKSLTPDDYHKYPVNMGGKIYYVPTHWNKHYGTWRVYLPTINSLDKVMVSSTIAADAAARIMCCASEEEANKIKDYIQSEDISNIINKLRMNGRISGRRVNQIPCP